MRSISIFSVIDLFRLLLWVLSLTHSSGPSNLQHRPHVQVIYLHSDLPLLSSRASPRGRATGSRWRSWPGSSRWSSFSAKQWNYTLGKLDRHWKIRLTEHVKGFGSGPFFPWIRIRFPISSRSRSGFQMILDPDFWEVGSIYSQSRTGSETLNMAIYKYRQERNQLRNLGLISKIHGSINDFSIPMVVLLLHCC